MAHLNLFLLGAPRVEIDGVPVDLNRRKVIAILIYLATTRRRHRRDALATLFWPEADQRAARASLRRELHTLTSTLGGDWIDADRESLALVPDAQIWVDVEAFRQHLMVWRNHEHPDMVCEQCVTELVSAVALYKGDFLVGFTLSDAPEFDDWQFFQSESLRRELASILERLVQWHSARNECEQAIEYARRRLALDPLHEPVHRTLMRLYASAEQTAAAVRQYQECLRLLGQELGVEPEAETTDLFESIRTRRFPPAEKGDARSILRQDDKRITAPSQPTSPAPSPLVTPSPRHNLPPQPTPFIGRAQELASIVQRLCDPACRLLTLVGPGGIGKTRLALQVAQTLLDGSISSWDSYLAIQSPPTDKQHSAQITPLAFEAGIYFVPLTAVDSLRELTLAIADVLGLDFAAGDSPQQQLLDALRKKQMVLVLDNFELILAADKEGEARAFLSALLATALGIKLLVTSREALNLQEEWFHHIGGLGFPEKYSKSKGAIAGYDAVRLFEQCARRAHPDFSLAREEAHVAQICQLVEGMPLALELAAAWLKVLTPEAIAAEIRRNLDIFTTRHQNMPERHRSLRVVFEQTWQRLTQEEQLVLSKLAIFHGGCTRDAAARVAGGTVMVLGTLVDKALLHRDDQSLVSGKDESRFQFHPLLRQYAAEKLQAASALLAQTEAVHAQYYLNLVASQSKDLKSAARKTALAVLDAEFANIHAAWQWAVTKQDAETLARFALPLSAVFEKRIEEGVKLFRQAAAVLDETDRTHQGALGTVLVAQAEQMMRLGNDPAHCIHLAERALTLLQQEEMPEAKLKATNLLGNAFWLQGDYPKAKRMLEEGLAFLRMYGPHTEIGDLLIRLGLVERELYHEQEVMAFYQRSLAELRTLNDPVSLAHQLLIYGEYLVVHDQLQEGARFLAESLALARAAGGTDFFPFILMHLGTTAYKLGNYAEAENYLCEVLTIAQAEARVHPEALAHLFLGRVKVAQQRLAEAEEHLLRGLQLGWSHRLTLVATLALVCFAEYYMAQDQLSHAVVLLTAALACPATEQRDKQMAARQLALLQEEIAADEFEKATAHGNASSLEEVVTQLLDSAPLVSPSSTLSPDHMLD